MAINLCESFRAMFYTPFYLPFALGTYDAEVTEGCFRRSRRHPAASAPIAPTA